MSFEYKRHIGFVLERPTYFEKLSGMEYLEFAGAMYDIGEGDIRTRAQELLEYFDLSEKRSALIETYSNGMKKKISLAAAMIHHPQLLILDEPLEGMDPVSAVRTKEVLLDLKIRGTSVIIASHQLDSVEILCDEIAIIDKGKNIFQSTIAGVRDIVRNEGTQERYGSLEAFFVDIIGNHGNHSHSSTISWLTP
jgi:ABC-2 type transport system ATP-binding protein